MTIRFMLDSDNLTDLDPVASILATYSDLVPTPADLRAKFPHSIIVLIDRGLGDPSGEATVFDIERGTMTVDQAVKEYDRKNAAGMKYLTAYANRANLPAVDSAFGARQVFRWVATLDGTSHISGIRALHGPAAIQCLPESDLGIHADGSLVFEDSWNPQPSTATITGLIHDLTQLGNRSKSVADDLAQLAAHLSA